jgi:hypothetical protein
MIVKMFVGSLIYLSMPAETNTILCIWFSILHVLLFLVFFHFSQQSSTLLRSLYRGCHCALLNFCVPRPIFLLNSFALNLLIPRHTYSQVFRHTIASKSFEDFLSISSLRT